MCSDCAKELRLQSNKCPVCRQPIEELLEIKVDEGNKALLLQSRYIINVTLTSIFSIISFPRVLHVWSLLLCINPQLQNQGFRSRVNAPWQNKNKVWPRLLYEYCCVHELQLQEWSLLIRICTVTYCNSFCLIL